MGNVQLYEGKVKVQVTVTVDDGEIVRHLPNGESITETYEQIIFQQGSEFRSWNVLFQLDERHSSF